MSATIESIRTEGGGVSAGPWQDFIGGRWLERIDVRDFIQANVTRIAVTRRSWPGRPNAPARCGCA